MTENLKRDQLKEWLRQSGQTAQASYKGTGKTKKSRKKKKGLSDSDFDTASETEAHSSQMQYRDSVDHTKTVTADFVIKPKRKTLAPFLSPKAYNFKKGFECPEALKR